MDEAFARELAARYGSPLYVYDLDVVDRRLADLRAALPEGAGLLYSLKANPLPAIVRTLVSGGVRAEVSSPGELGVALGAGFAPGEVLYTGPGKTDAEVRAALAIGVARFSCESEGDLRRVERCAAEAHRAVRVLLRVNPPEGGGNALAMSGVPSQFGLEPASAYALLRRGTLADGAVEMDGLHVYYGTQIRDAAALAAQAERILALADWLYERLPPPGVVDLGGGFPSPFGTCGAAPDLSGLRPALQGLLAGRPPETQHWFESGRFLTASSGTLLATVLESKTSHGHRFVVLDAGINHLGGMAGLGRLHLPALHVRPLGGSDGEGGASGPATVVGPLCTPLDVLARGDDVADVRPGDLVTVPNVGAYAATASLTGFLSRTPAAEVACRGTRVIGAYRLRGGHARLDAA